MWLARRQVLGDVTVMLRFYCRLGVYVGRSGQWADTGVTSVQNVWLIGCVGCFVDCLGWLVISPLGAAGLLG